MEQQNKQEITVNYHYIPKSKQNKSFITSSEHERLWVKRFLTKIKVPNWQYSITPVNCYESFEVSFKYQQKHYRAEFKIRKCNSDTYSSALIERVKFQALKTPGIYKGEVPLYVFVYNKDSSYRIWDLSKIKEDDLSWKQEMHWIDGNDRSKGKKLKWVSYIDNNLSYVRFFDDNPEKQD